MKKIIYTIIFYLTTSSLFSQNEVIIFADSFANFSKWSTTDLTGANTTYGVWKRRIFTDPLGAFKTSSNGFAAFESEDALGDNANCENGLAEDGVMTLSTPINLSTYDNAFLQFAEYSKGNTIIETSTDNVTWTELLNRSNTKSYSSSKTFISLSSLALNPNPVYIRFRYKGQDNGYWLIDDLKIISKTVKTDLMLSSFGLPKYTKKGESVSFFGYLINKGYDTTKELEIGYTINGGQIYKSSRNYTTLGAAGIQPEFIDTFTHSVPYVFNTLGKQVIKVFVVSSNNKPETYKVNDTITFETVVLNGTEKTVLFEEASGAWCGWCVDGHINLKNMFEKYGSKMVGGVIHNGDDMSTKQGDTVNSKFADGYPTGFIDRTSFSGSVGKSRGEWEDLVDYQKGLISPLGVSIRNKTFDSVTRNYSFEVFVKFSDDFNNADSLRVTSYFVEDKVRGFGSKWEQQNYYSSELAPSGGNDPDHPFWNLPKIIKGYYHNHVIEDFLTPTWGVTLFPKNVKAGDTFVKKFSGTLPKEVTVTTPSGLAEQETEYVNTKSGPSKYKFKDMEIIAFVSSFGDKDKSKFGVLNASGLKLSQEEVEETIFSLKSKAISKTETSCVKPQSTLENTISNLSTSAIELEYEVKVISNNNDKWGDIIINDSTNKFLSNIASGTINLKASEKNRILNVIFDTKDIAGIGEVELTIFDKKDPENTKQVVNYKLSKSKCETVSTSFFSVSGSDTVYYVHYDCGEDVIELKKTFTNLSSLSTKNYVWHGELKDYPSTWGDASFCDPKNCFKLPYSGGEFSLEAKGQGELKLDVDTKGIADDAYIVITIFDKSDSAKSVKKLRFKIVKSKCTTLSIDSKTNQNIEFEYNGKELVIDKKMLNNKLIVSDMLGKILFDEKILFDRIEFLPQNGVYIGAIISNEGEKIKSIKFVVK